MATLLGIPANRIGQRPVVEVGNPVPLTDSRGRQISTHGLPAFTVQAEGTDYAYSPPIPVKRAFVKRFIVEKAERASPSELAVFMALAITTRWASAYLLIDGKGNPVRTANGKGLAVIKTLGNVTATRTIQELVAQTGLEYGVVSKALRHWEKLGVLKPIDRTYRKKETKEGPRKAGRREKLLRYEIPPEYVWNGHIGLGTGYENTCLQQNEFNLL